MKFLLLIMEIINHLKSFKSNITLFKRNDSFQLEKLSLINSLNTTFTTNFFWSNLTHLTFLIDIHYKGIISLNKCIGNLPSSSIFDFLNGLGNLILVWVLSVVDSIFLSISSVPSTSFWSPSSWKKIFFSESLIVYL